MCKTTTVVRMRSRNWSSRKYQSPTFVKVSCTSRLFNIGTQTLKIFQRKLKKKQILYNMFTYSILQSSATIFMRNRFHSHAHSIFQSFAAMFVARNFHTRAHRKLVLEKRQSFASLRVLCSLCKITPRCRTNVRTTYLSIIRDNLLESCIWLHACFVVVGDVMSRW